MATNQRDVQLVVKATDNASKALSTITTALQKLGDGQEDIAGSAKGTADALSAIGKVAATIGTAYAKFTTETDKASASFASQGKSLGETKDALAAVEAQITSLQKVQADFAKLSPISRAEADTAKQIALVGTAYDKLSQKQTQLAATAAVQEAAYIKSNYALQQMEVEAAQAEKAIERLTEAQYDNSKAVQANAEQQRIAAAAEAASQEQLAKDAEAAADRKIKAAQQVADAQLAAARKAVIQQKVSVTDLAGTAAASQQQAQTGIQSITSTVSSNQGGFATAGQKQALADLQTAAKTYKDAVTALTVASSQLNDVLKDSSATEADLALAQARVKQTFDASKASIDSVKSSLAGLNAVSVSAASSVARIPAAVRDGASAQNESADATKNNNAALSDLFENSRRSLSLFQRLRGEVLSLAASYVGLFGAVQGVKDVIQTNIEVQSAQTRLSAVTGGDLAAVAEEMTILKQTADKLGISLKVITDTWTSFAIATKNSELTLNESRQVFLNVASAAKTLHLSADRTQLVFEALTQIVSKGAVQMEELRQQLGDSLPGALQAMADGLGVTTAKLIQMMQAGQVTARALIPFSEALKNSLGAGAQAGIDGAQASITRFQNAVTNAQRTIGNSGVFDAVVDALKKITDYMNSIDGQLTFQKLGAAVAGLIKVLVIVVSNLDLILAGLAAFATIKGVGAISAMVTGFLELRTAIAGATTAMGALGIATSAAGGVIGLALAALAAGVTYFITKSSDQDKAVLTSKDAVDQIGAAWRISGGNAKVYADELSKINFIQLSKDADTLSASLKSAQGAFGDFFTRSFALGAKNGAFGDDLPIFSQVNDLIVAVQKGQLPVAAFQKQLLALANANPVITNLAGRLLDASTGLGTLEDASNRANAGLANLKGSADDAQKAIVGANTSVEDSKQQATAAAAAWERYGKALKAMQKLSPLDKLSETRDANTQAVNDQLKNATDSANTDQALTPDARKAAIDAATNLAQVALKAINVEFDNDRQKLLLQQGTTNTQSSVAASADLIKSREGFSPTASYDVNAYRAGYGSDTVTLSDGSIQKITQGMTVSQTDADRDLLRRIDEFQAVVKNQIGGDRFNSFDTQQQAALTSIAYNYGRLPSQIVEAVKTGTNAEIASAVRGLATDNGGVNAGRREQEATILQTDSPKIDANNSARQTKEQDDATKKLGDSIRTVNDELTQAELKQTQSALEADIYNKTVAKGIPLESSAGKLIADRVTKLYEATAATQAGIIEEQRVNALLALRQQLMSAIANAQKNNRQGDVAKYTAQLTQVNGQLQIEQTNSNELNALLASRTDIQNQLNLAQATGASDDQVATLKQQLLDVNTQLAAAVVTTNQLQTAMSLPGIRGAAADLKSVNDKALQYKTSLVDANSINRDFAQGATTVFKQVGESFADVIKGTKGLGGAFQDVKDAFLNFAADFLEKIAEMIIQQLIFNAIGGTTGTGGIGGAIAGLVSSKNHDGGMAGQGTPTLANPAWFNNAVRYHTGGIAGLKPNEVPSILEKGEEVLPANDPRHVNNGGRGSAAPQVKVVNAFDAGSFLSEALNSPEGGDAIFNHVRNNKTKYKTVLNLS